MSQGILAQNSPERSASPGPKAAGFWEQVNAVIM